jgi:hypothetical protein
MCEVFEVSRSGYYAWRKRKQKPAKDQWLADLIIECQTACHQTYGVRRVKRWILRQKGKNVNKKAVLRMMRKLDLLAQIRRRRPYTHYKLAAHKYDNLLQRKFEQSAPNRFWATDITYIPTYQEWYAVPLRCDRSLRPDGVVMENWNGYDSITCNGYC